MWIYNFDWRMNYPRKYSGQNSISLEELLRLNALRLPSGTAVGREAELCGAVGDRETLP